MAELTYVMNASRMVKSMGKTVVPSHCILDLAREGHKKVLQCYLKL